MSEQKLAQFQNLTADLLLRHRSILDVLSKLQETGGRTNRALTKAITDCGCLKVEAGKQSYASANSLIEAKEMSDTHLRGTLCEHCRDDVISEIGKNMFYLVSLCNLLQIELNDVIDQEMNKLSTLGLFNLC